MGSRFVFRTFFRKVLHSIVHCFRRALLPFFRSFHGLFLQLVFKRWQRQSPGQIVLKGQFVFNGRRINDLEVGIFVVGRIIGCIRIDGRIVSGLFLKHHFLFRCFFRRFFVRGLRQALFNHVNFGQCKRFFGLHSRTFFLGAEQAVVHFSIASHAGECFLRSILLALFFGASGTASGHDSFNRNDGFESLSFAFAGHILKVDVDAVFLAPLQEFALKVHLLLCHVVEVDVMADYAVGNKPMAKAESAVQVNGTHQCFEGIATNVCVRHARALCSLNEAFQPHLGGQFVQRFTLHNFRAG